MSERPLRAAHALTASILGSLLLAVCVLAAPRGAGAADIPQPSYAAPPALLTHKAVFRDAVQRVGDTPVWALIDHGVNIVLIEGPDGLVLFDTGLHDAYARKALQRIRAISDKPIVAVIYSHHHMDHINGAGFLVDAKDVAAGRIPVIAASNLMREMSDEAVMNAPIMALRSAYMFGFGLDGQARQDNYVGCCGDLDDSSAAPHTNAFIPPTVLVEDELSLELGGIRFEFFRTGGEAASHIAAFLPEYGVLLSGDEVQGPTFPNLHSLRGTKMRDANAWVRGLDRMRGYHAAHMVPTHGNPVSGAAQVAHVLTLYRDALQYTHDQAIRYINKGLVHDELAAQLPGLPDYLREEPWTGEHYGNVPSAARSYFTGYISWFSGDAVELMPTPRAEYARRLVAMMGGRDAVAEAATDALRKDDPQFAAELATYLIRVNSEDAGALDIKAAAFRALGYRQVNMNWRNFYLMGARDLEGGVNMRDYTRQIDNPANLSRLPLPVLVDSIRYRVAAEKARDAHIELALAFAGGERYVLELRNSVIEVRKGASPDAVEVQLDAETFAALMLGTLDPGAAFAQKRLGIRGDAEQVNRFFALLDYDIAPRSLVRR